MKYNHIVWDWNGTLFDDVDFSIECVNALLSRHGLSKVTKERYYEVFGFPIVDYYARLGFDFEKTPYSLLARQYMDRYMPGSKNCRLRSDAQQAIDALKDLGCVNTVLSASKRDYLISQMQNVGIKNIDNVYGIDNIHAAGKEDIAARLGREHKKDTILFVGDTPHDKLAATAAGADCVFVAGGHKSKDELLKYGLVFDSLSDIVDYVASGK